MYSYRVRSNSFSLSSASFATNDVSIHYADLSKKFFLAIGCASESGQDRSQSGLSALRSAIDISRIGKAQWPQR
jgi:hypothetical protein